MDLKKFKTEKFLSALIVVIALFLVASVFGREIGTNVSLAEEESGASAPSSTESSSNEDSENSDGDDGAASQDGASEESNEEKSEASAPSAASIKRVPAGVSAEEISEKSSSEASQQSAGEVSETSEESQEISEESIKYVEGYGEVVSREGDVALVRRDEKLFFLIPVDVESRVTLDAQGAVVDEKKSLLNWLLSVFSF